MKNWKLFLAVLLVAVFAIFGVASSSEEADEQTSTGTETAQVETAEADTNLGKYSVTIDSCRMAQDYEGKPVVIVKYNFTNVSDENPAAFYIAFDDNAYQGGVGLNESDLLPDSANYSSDNQMKEIKQGATLAVEVAYTLNDTTTDVEVEVEELFSFDDKKITKVFTIAQ